VAIMMVGLQGSGKPRDRETRAPPDPARQAQGADVPRSIFYRPAAMEQLAVLGRDLDIPTVPTSPARSRRRLAKRAAGSRQTRGYDVVLLDTAGAPRSTKRCGGSRRDQNISQSARSAAGRGFLDRQDAVKPRAIL